MAVGQSEVGGLRASDVNGVKVYNVSAGKSVPDWLSDKKKRALRKDEGKFLLQIYRSGQQTRPFIAG